MSYYIIIRGPAACGKSTISKILKEKLNAFYISFDEVIEKYQLEVSNGRGISKESFIKANEMVVDSAKNEIQSNNIVIFDGCFYHKDQLKNLEDSLPFKHFIFDFKASLNECIKRDEGRKSIGKDSVEAVYNMVSEFNYGIPINTDNRTKEDVVASLLDIINSGK